MKFIKNSLRFFVHVRHLTLCPFGCPLGSYPSSWLTKWGPDGTAQISIPSCWMFVLLARHFHIASLWRPNMFSTMDYLRAAGKQIELNTTQFLLCLKDHSSIDRRRESWDASPIQIYFAQEAIEPSIHHRLQRNYCNFQPCVLHIARTGTANDGGAKNFEKVQQTHYHAR